MKRIYFHFMIVITIFVSCKKKSTKTNTTTNTTSSDGCIAPAPESPAAAGQLVFKLPSEVNPCDVDGYIVGFKDQLKVLASNDGKYYISNIPAGDLDVIVTLSSASFGLQTNKVSDRGVRLKKLKFLIGERNDQGEIVVPKYGSLTGSVKLIGQTVHSGINVYVPGTDIISKTDVNGNFGFSKVPIGEHNLFFEKDGYHRGQIEGITLLQILNWQFQRAKMHLF
jgi:hypothetical protein